MPFTIPNATNSTDVQAGLDSVDFSTMVAGIFANGVLTGCAVTAQGAPDMTLAVAAGTVQNGGVAVPVTAGNVTVTANVSGFTRLDLVVVSNTGQVSVLAGTGSAAPVFPAPPSTSTVLAAVKVLTAAAAIAADKIVDKRVFVEPVKFVNVKAYGAVGDVRTVADAAVTTGTATLTSATAAFTAGDVGKLVTVNGAGASGAVLATTVSGYTNATTVTLAANASTSVSGALLALGTDDSAAMQAAITAAAAVRGVVYFPPGVYARGASTVTLTVNVVLRGAGMDVSTIYAMRTATRLFEDPLSGFPVNSFSGMEDLTLWGFADRTNSQGGDVDRLCVMRAERIWWRRVHGIYSRQMSLTGVGSLEGRAENCLIEKSFRDAINITGSGRGVIINNTMKEIGDDACAFHVSAGLSAGTIVAPQAVVVGNRMEKCFGIKLLGTCAATVVGNSGQFMIAYGVYIGYDAAYGEGDRDTMALNVSGNVFRDIIDYALLGGGTICRGIWFAPRPPSKGALAYYPGMVGVGTGTAATVLATGASASGFSAPINGNADATAGPATGVFGSTINNNIFIQTLEGLTKFSDAGFGTFFSPNTGSGADPTMTGTVYRTGGNTSTGISCSDGGLRDTLIEQNIVYGFQFGMLFDSFPVMPQVTVRRNKIQRVRHGISFGTGSPSGWFMIDSNDFDIDPLFESIEREKVTGVLNGHWAWTNASSALCVYNFGVTGIYFTRNTVRNCMNIIGPDAAPAIWDNIIYSDTATLGVANGDAGGVTFSDSISAANRIIQYVSDPRSTTYGQVRTGIDLTATAVPSSGTYAKGQLVRNQTPSVANNKTIFGWLRLTNTTTHTAGTDWATLYFAHTVANDQPRTTFSNAAYTAVATDRIIDQIGTMSAARVITLPLANAVPGGTILQVVDSSRTVTGTFTISWARAGSDTINGGTANVVAANAAGGTGRIMSDGTSKWNTV